MSDWFEWMHIDPETLKEHVEKAGLVFELIKKIETRYLCRITTK